jgi:hypothetical protein
MKHKIIWCVIKINYLYQMLYTDPSDVAALGDSAAAADRDRSRPLIRLLWPWEMHFKIVSFFQYSVNKFERSASKLYLYGS